MCMYAHIKCMFVGLLVCHACMNVCMCTGDPDALYVLGTLESDQSQAAKFFQSASAQGHPKGQCNLGVCFEKGLGETSCACVVCRLLMLVVYCCLLMSTVYLQS